MPSRFSRSLHRFFNLKQRSLLRGSGVVLLSLFAAFRLSHFPDDARSPWLVLPLLTAAAGTFDTIRCIQRQWNWYHGGVVLLIYMDLMAMSLILFFLIYPIWL